MPYFVKQSSNDPIDVSPAVALCVCAYVAAAPSMIVSSRAPSATSVTPRGTTTRDLTVSVWL